MKAIISVFDDDGKMVAKEQAIEPYLETISYDFSNMCKVKHAEFKFKIAKLMMEDNPEERIELMKLKAD